MVTLSHNTAMPQGIIRRIFSGIGFVLGGKAAAGLISLAYLILATRFLGPAEFGMLVLAHGYVATVALIFGFPVWQTILRYGAQANQNGSLDRLVRLLHFGAKLELAAGVLAIAVAMMLVPLVGPRLGWSAEAMSFAQLYSFAVLGGVRSTPAGYAQLLGRFDLIGLHNMVQPSVRLTGALIVIAFGWGLKAFLVVWLCGALAEFAVLWGMGIWLAHRNLGNILWRPEKGKASQDNPGIWRFLFASNADATLGELAGRLTPLIIGWILGPAMAGLFAVAQRASVVISQPSQILGNTVFAEISHLIARGQGGAPLRQTLARVIGIALLVALPVLIIVTLFPNEIVNVLAGPAFSAAASVMIALVVARTIGIIGPPCSSALSALGQPALSMSANLFSSLICLSMLPWLLHSYGIMGGGIQALCQTALASSIMAFLVWRSSLKQFDRC